MGTNERTGGAAIELSDAVRGRALANGAVGARWLRDLPAVVEELADRWDLTVGRTMGSGTAAYVAGATTERGEPVVLKVAMPAEIDGEGAFERAVEMFRLADGRGCARLLAHDDEHDALLLEWLGPNLDSMGLSIREQLEIICRTVAPLWVPVPDGALLKSGADHAEWLASSISATWHALGHPCAARTIEVALAFAAERAAAFDPATAVLVHGDAHSWNTLDAGDGTFRLVDPEGFLSEPAHDLGIPMRELNDELVGGDDDHRIGRQRAALLGQLTGADPEAIWQWGSIERVWNGLYSLTLGEEQGHAYLATSDRWAEG